MFKASLLLKELMVNSCEYKIPCRRKTYVYVVILYHNEETFDQTRQNIPLPNAEKEKE